MQHPKAPTARSIRIEDGRARRAWLGLALTAALMGAAAAMEASATAADLPETTRLVDLAVGRTRIVAIKPYTFSFDKDGASINASWISECDGYGKFGKPNQKFPDDSAAIKLQPGDFLMIDKSNAGDAKAVGVTVEVTVYSKDAPDAPKQHFTLSCVHTYLALVASSDPKTATVRDLVHALDGAVAVNGELTEATSQKTPTVAGDAPALKRVSAAPSRETASAPVVRRPANDIKDAGAAGGSAPGGTVAE